MSKVALAPLAPELADWTRPSIWLLDAIERRKIYAIYIQPHTIRTIERYR